MSNSIDIKDKIAEGGYNSVMALHSLWTRDKKDRIKRKEREITRLNVFQCWKRLSRPEANPQIYVDVSQAGK